MFFSFKSERYRGFNKPRYAGSPMTATVTNRNARFRQFAGAAMSLFLSCIAPAIERGKGVLMRS
jgi:hypothetical protein